MFKFIIAAVIAAVLSAAIGVHPVFGVVIGLILISYLGIKLADKLDKS